MKKRTRNLKLISFVMSMILVLLILPLGSIAYALENRYEVLNEVVELRDENTKHFENPDGSYTAIMYNNAVHRKDSNGNWQDIDNRMSEGEIKNKQAYITPDGRTVFAKKIKQNDNEIYTLSENGYRITVSFANENIKNSNAKLSNHASKYTPSGRDDLDTQYKKLKQIDNNTTLLYKNVLKDIDLEYVLSSNNIKENIIVKELQDEYSYTFIYSLENLTATLNEDGSVSLFDSESGEQKYCIPVPYMYDANGNTSYEVEYSLETLENGDYAFTVSADSEWISSAKLPVVIDPTVSFSACPYDTYIDANNPDTNYGNHRNMYVGTSQIVYMNPGFLFNIPDDATVDKVELCVPYYFSANATLSPLLKVHPVTVDWNEQTWTWSLASQYTNQGRSMSNTALISLPTTSSTSADSPSCAKFDITKMYKSAYEGNPFYGMAISYSGSGALSVIILSGETNDNTYSKYHLTYQRDALIANGEYFIENVAFDGAFLNSDTINSNNILAYDQSEYQTWRIEYLHNGYYKITNVIHNKCLSVPNANINVADSSFVLELYEPIARKQWQIIDVGNGMCKFSPRSNESMFISADGLGVNVKQKTNQVDYTDEWKICEYERVRLLPIWDDDGGDRYGFVSGVTNILTTEMNNGISIIRSVSELDYLTKDYYKYEIIDYLDSCEVFITHTHASQTGFSINQFGNQFTINDLNGEYFSDLEFVLLLTCNTGIGYDPSHITNRTPVNIIEQFVISGADVAVGFNSTTTDVDCNIFAVDLMDKMTNGMTIQVAINAISNEYLSGNPKGYIENIAAKAVIAGNTNYCLR